MNIFEVLKAARLVSWIYRPLSTLVGLITIRLINDRIGIDGYGGVALMLALYTGVAAVDLGFLQSLSRFVARHSGEDSDVRSRFWATSLLIALALFCMQLTLIVISVNILGASNELHTMSIVEGFGIGAIFIGGNLLSINSAIFAGWQRYGIGGAAKIARTLLYLLAIYLLWLFNQLNIRSVLWFNAIATFLPNLVLCAILYLTSHSKITFCWQGFPATHKKMTREVLNYSLKGWLFTASTILVSSGSIFLTGLRLPTASVAQLQIALVLYTGVAAFVTGSMAPLTTIRARLSDGTESSRKKVADTARTLVDETLLLTAMLIVFFSLHIKTVLSFMLGQQSLDSTLLKNTTETVMIVLLPGIAILPWFTFRFALVGSTDNSQYSWRLFFGTLVALGVGFLISIGLNSHLPIAIGITAALIYRGTLAFQLGSNVISGLKSTQIILPLLFCLMLCFTIGLIGKWVPLEIELWRFETAHFQAAVYMFICGIIYFSRNRLENFMFFRLAVRENETGR